MNTLLLSFANSEFNRLQTLTNEYVGLNDLLRERDSRGDFRVVSRPIATREQLASDIQVYEESLCLFLFSGHAGNSSICLEDGVGHLKGIAALLGSCPNLKVVILNGCSTVGQVNDLLEGGVPIVIATSAPVGDEKATKFSLALFNALSILKESILDAFNKAKSIVQFYGSTSFNTVSTRGLSSEPIDKEIWGIYYYPNNSGIASEWKLPEYRLGNTEPVRSQKAEIRELIANNKIKEAINMLRANPELEQDATSLSASFKSLERDVRMDYISFSESRSQRAKIVAAALALVDQLD